MMAVQQQQSDSNTSIIDPGLRVLIDEHTTEADLQELLALAHEHLDEQVRNNPDALLAILNRVSRLAQQNERTQAQIIALMEQIANAQGGRFKKLLRLIFSGVIKKLKGGRYKVGAIAFYGGIEDIDDIDRCNQYETPKDRANKAIFNEAQNGVIREEGDPFDIDTVFYSSDESRHDILHTEVLMVERELQERLAQAKAIEAGGTADVDALIDDVDNIMRAWDAQVMGKAVMVDDTTALQATK